MTSRNSFRMMMAVAKQHDDDDAENGRSRAVSLGGSRDLITISLLSTVLPPQGVSSSSDLLAGIRPTSSAGQRWDALLSCTVCSHRIPTQVSRLPIQ